jgi:hypothetical protein
MGLARKVLAAWIIRPQNPQILVKNYYVEIGIIFAFIHENADLARRDPAVSPRPMRIISWR